MSDGDDILEPPEEDPEDEQDRGEPEEDPEERAEHVRPAMPPGWAHDYISKQYSGLFAQLSRSITKNLFAGVTPLNTANWFPHIKTTDLLLPQLKLATPMMDSVLGQLGKNVTDVVGSQTLFRSLATLLEQQRRQWDSVFEGLRTLTEKFLPPNWKDVKYPDFATIEAILLDEGIPLAWVPSHHILQALLDAPDAAARRRIIGRRWRGVVSDCEAVLNGVSHRALQCHLPFAMDITHALRDGHVSAAQALSANLLDSILRRNFDKQSFKTVTTNKKGGSRFDLDDYRGRAAFTLAPIWRAYAEYWDSQGDPIPRVFGRHPSAHAVSRTQYSRVNAVVGLMLVTSLLKLLDSELAP